MAKIQFFDMTKNKFKILVRDLLCSAKNILSLKILYRRLTIVLVQTGWCHAEPAWRALPAWRSTADRADRRREASA
jgi:hypothetical protein